MLVVYSVLVLIVWVLIDECGLWCVWCFNVVGALCYCGCFSIVCISVSWVCVSVHCVMVCKHGMVWHVLCVVYFASV